MSTPSSSRKPDISLTVCSYSKVLDIIANKWTALVIYALESGSIRYGDMSRRIEGISKKMLTQTLRELERDGLVRRDYTPTLPPIVDYALTPLGASMLRPLRELKQWASDNFPFVEEARTTYDQQAVKDEA